MSALVDALVKFAKAANVAGIVLADGKVSLGDLPVVLGSLGDLGGLVSVDYAEVLVEGAKLNDVDKAAAVAAFKQAFDIPNDKEEAAIETLVDAALSGAVAFATALKGLALLKAA